MNEVWWRECSMQLLIDKNSIDVEGKMRMKYK